MKTFTIIFTALTILSFSQAEAGFSQNTSNNSHDCTKSFNGKESVSNQEDRRDKIQLVKDALRGQAASGTTPTPLNAEKND